MIVQTKFRPARPLRRTLPRPRVTALLLAAFDYRLTVLQAGTGYGKTTALAELPERDQPVVWYHLDVEDADPLIFLLHLVGGFTNLLNSRSTPPLSLAGALANVTPASAWPLLDALINYLNEQLIEPTLLILDDAHLLNNNQSTLALVERLIKHGPERLHIVCSCRQPPALASLVTLRVRGELLDIGEEDLAFTRDEISTLFHEQYKYTLSGDELDVLAQETEGWAIALQLVWQRLARGEPSRSISDALRRFKGLKEDLFTYLAREVLEKEPQERQQFLLTSSVLRVLSPEACDHIQGAPGSGSLGSAMLLRDLLDAGLFVVEISPDQYRYHPLFREFLYGQLPADERATLHLAAAEWYRDQGDPEEAIYHFLKGDAPCEAADLMLKHGRAMINAGWLELLGGWIGALPLSVLEALPGLLIYLGDIARLHSRFAEALGWYQQAEERYRLRGDTPGVAQALRGQARVYLDTVNPSQAEAPLREALRLSDGHDDREARATLLDLLAENQLNQGHTDEAQALRAQAQQLREEGPGEAELDVRVMLRTGRIEEAMTALMAQAEQERYEPVLRPRAHRETLLLLSLIEACRGEADSAYQHALEGTERGRALDSPFVTAVGLMRQGHALLVRDGVQAVGEARRCFEEAIAISHQLDVSRLRVEANWGLCRAFGYAGDLLNAERAAMQGIEIARQAGDEWIIAHIRVTIAAALVTVKRCNEALPLLMEAETGFRECSDLFGVSLARLWKCLLWQQSGQAAHLRYALDELLQDVKAHRYETLFTRRTLAGPPDPRCLLPVLLVARTMEAHVSFTSDLLQQMGLEKLQIHPGYQLRVKALGAFRVWLGDQELTAGDWQREKARQLFQLLLTSRRLMLDRDVICDQLWPDLSPDVAQRDFKVALNALYKALEPQREAGAPSAYVVRDGSLYGLRPEADVWLDAEEFERAVIEGDALLDTDHAAALNHYRRALSLYTGDFLEEYIYEDWCSEERGHLRTLYLRAADRLSRALLKDHTWEAAIQVCQLIITRDNCWENAYRLMMVAYARLGNRAQALRIYQSLEDHLRAELGVDPAPETRALYHLIAHSGLPDLPE